jgi:hypothetical protein
MHPLVSSCLGVKETCTWGQVTIMAARYIAPFKVHCSQLHIFQMCCPYESYHYSMIIVCTCLSMITTIEGERKGEREIKRTHEPGVLCYFKSTTLILFFPLLNIGTSLSLLLFLVNFNHQINITCFLFCAVHR